MKRKTVKGKDLLQLSCDGEQSSRLVARRTEESKNGGWSLLCLSLWLGVCLQEKSRHVNGSNWRENVLCDRREVTAEMLSFK